MKLFVQRGYHLSSLALPAKAIYTIFLAFIGLGLWTSWDLYADRIGGDLSAAPGRPSVQERYVEGPPPGAATQGLPASLAPSAAGGPTLELPDPGPALDLPAEGEAIGAAPAAAAAPPGAATQGLPASPAPSAAGGPTLALPDPGPALDLPAGGGAMGAAPEVAPSESVKGPWIKDVFHQHLFSISVVFLILAHLFMLTRLHPGLALLVVLAAGLSSLLHVLAPVIIWKTGGALWLMPVTGAAMGVSWSLMAAWTLLALWWPRRPPRAGPQGDGAGAPA